MDKKKKTEKARGGFKFDVRKGTWSLASGGKQAAVMQNAGCRLQVNGRAYALSDADELEAVTRGMIKEAHGRCWRLEVTAFYRRPGFTWRLCFDVPEQGVYVRISSEIHNDSASALTLGDCDLMLVESAAGGVLRLGPHPEQQRIFAFNGGLATQRVKRIATDGGNHKTFYLQHIYNPATQNTFFAGFTSYDRMRTPCQCRFDARKKTIDCIASCQFQDFSLPPGAAAPSETLSVELADDPYAVLTRWADAVARQYQPRVWNKPPPVGWIGWSWVDQSTEIPEVQVDKNVRAIRERLAGFGVDYLWISISNLKDGLPGNWLECNEQKFPHGFRKTVNKIIRAGIRPGLWTGLFYINEAAKSTFEENYNNLYRDHQTGKPIPGGRWLWAYKAKDGAEPLNYVLDCSHPRSLQYLKKIYTAYRKWGIRYYMLDFLDDGPVKDEFKHVDYHDQSMIRGPGIPRRGMLTARRAARADTHLLSASGSTLALTTGTVDTMRIGMDYGEGRQLQSRFASYPATYVVNGSYGSSGSSQDNCLQNTAAYFFTHRKLFLNGQNMLTVDFPIPRNEAEFSTTLFGMTGSPIMLGDQLDRISPERLEMIKKVLPRPADWPFPADLFQRVYPEDYARVLVAPVQTAWGAWSVVAVFNLDERAAVTDITMESLRLPSDREFRVWDFWNVRYCGCVQGKFSVEVPVKSCRLLRLTPVSAHPAVLSSDMHVRQGQLDLRDVEWDKRQQVLRGVAVRPKGSRGNVYIAAPAGWKPVDYSGVFVAKDARDGTLVIRRPLDFRRARVAWSVPFATLNAEEKHWQREHAKKRGESANVPCRAVV